MSIKPRNSADGDVSWMLRLVLVVEPAEGSGCSPPAVRAVQAGALAGSGNVWRGRSREIVPSGTVHPSPTVSLKFLSVDGVDLVIPRPLLLELTAFIFLASEAVVDR